MGNIDNYHWDDDKSELTKAEHGVGLDEACKLIFYDEKTHWKVFENDNYPNQYRVITKTKKGFLTLAMEDISDEYGEFIKLISCWNSSPKEKGKLKND